MKKFICVILCIVMLFSVEAVSVSAALPEDVSIMPLYNNVGLTDSLFYIDQNGLAYVVVAYDGYSGITSGGIMTAKLERKVLGLFWETVDIGTSDNIWRVSSTAPTFSHAFTHQLSDTGTYRATIHYTIFGTGGASDKIDDVLTYTYS